MTDLTFLPLLEKIADKLPTIERYIVFTDAAHMPATSLRNAVAYEDVARRSGRRFRLEDVRREYRRRHVLHLRHDRQSQGRGLFAPLERAAHDAVAAAGCDRPFVARRRHADRADVPCQHLGGSPSPRRWRAAALVMPGAKLDGASVYELLNEFKVTCTGAVPTVWLLLLAASGKDRRQASVSGTGHHRRLGLPARHDQDVRGRLRRPGVPRLGHDRDEPARHASAR